MSGGGHPIIPQMEAKLLASLLVRDKTRAGVTNPWGVPHKSLATISQVGDKLMTLSEWLLVQLAVLSLGVIPSNVRGDQEPVLSN